MNVELARRTLHGGFRGGFALGCGAVSADITYAAIASFSLGAIVNRPAVKWPVAAAGLAFLLWLGIQSLRAAARHLRADPLAQSQNVPRASAQESAARASADGPRLPGAEQSEQIIEPAPSTRALGAYGTGLLMTLLNPFTLVFWFVAVPSAGAITKEPGHDLPMICAGVFIGTLSWVIFFAGLLSGLGRWRRPWWLAAADGAGGILLLALTIRMAWQLTKG